MDNDPDVLHSVPDALQRLVRFTTRGFYGLEHGLTIDVLVRNACVKEEDIQELLKFDKKQLRAILNQLKSDKFLKSRIFVETQADGKVTKHSYYFINYRSIANVIKYKLHQMQKRIETMERDSSNRPSFKCPMCQNTYSDLEVNQLIDPMFGTLNCTFCKTEVVEDANSTANQDTRTLQARFNLQTEPLCKLLKEIEHINLSIDILEPKPTLIPHLHPNTPGQRGSKVRGEQWAKKDSSNIDYHQHVVIDMNGDNNKTKEPTKEQPQWMQQSTLAPSTSAEKSSNKVETEGDDDSENKAINDEVLQTLLVQERSSKPSFVPVPPPSKEEESEDEFEDVDDDAEDNDPIVTVAGKPYRYEEVANRGQELISMMSAQEKAEYIQIGQSMYEDMDD